MAEVIGARADLDIKLGQSPSIAPGPFTNELQLVYNSVHLLSQYLDVLRGALESVPGQTPDKSLSFKRFFEGKLLQSVSAGMIVSAFGGGFVRGVGVIGPTTNTINAYNTNFTKQNWGLHSGNQFVALESGKVGDKIRIGAGAGVIKVAGIKCGQRVWASANRTLRALWTQDAGATVGMYRGYTLVADGGIYASYVGGNAGINSAGYPLIDPGNSTLHSKIYFYPVGFAVLDDYVLINSALPG